MKYCAQCGAITTRLTPNGDSRERDVCRSCREIFYVNPKLVVGCIVQYSGKILLCRRSIEPRRGFWTPPAGYLELNESAVEGAERETWEEANAKVSMSTPFCYLDILHIGQSYLMYRSRLEDLRYSAGDESLEVELFELDAIPWDELAFPVLWYSLNFFVEDQRQNRFQVHFGAIAYNGTGNRYDPHQYELRDRVSLPVSAAPFR